jgi:hypothetical protein
MGNQELDKVVDIRWVRLSEDKSFFSSNRMSFK